MKNQCNQKNSVSEVLFKQGEIIILYQMGTCAGQSKSAYVKIYYDKQGSKEVKLTKSKTVYQACRKAGITDEELGQSIITNFKVVQINRQTKLEDLKGTDANPNASKFTFYLHPKPQSIKPQPQPLPIQPQPPLNHPIYDFRPSNAPPPAPTPPPYNLFTIRILSVSLQFKIQCKNQSKPFKQIFESFLKKKKDTLSSIKLQDVDVIDKTTRCVINPKERISEIEGAAVEVHSGKEVLVSVWLRGEQVVVEMEKRRNVEAVLAHLRDVEVLGRGELCAVYQKERGGGKRRVLVNIGAELRTLRRYKQADQIELEVQATIK